MGMDAPEYGGDARSALALQDEGLEEAQIEKRLPASFH